MLSKQNFLTFFEESIFKEVSIEIQPNEFFEQHFEELLIHFFVGNVPYCKAFFFYSFDYWKNLSYAEFVRLYLKLILVRREQKASPFGLDGFIGLVYNIVKIDLLQYYIDDLKKHNQLDFAEGYVTNPYMDFQLYSLDEDSFIFKVYNITTFSEHRAVGERWQKEGAIRAIPLKKYIQSYEPPTTVWGCRFDAPKEELMPYYRCPKHWASWVYPLMAMKYNEKLATKTTEIKKLAARRTLLARENVELDFLAKIQAANSLEALQNIENQIHNAATDPELKTRLAKYAVKKQQFYVTL